MGKLTEAVRGMCTFQFFRDDALHYKTESGLIFPVPVADTGSATFGQEERGVILMRWIRKAIESYEKGNTEIEPLCKGVG
jgi:hypothetical protein